MFLRRKDFIFDKIDCVIIENLRFSCALKTLNSAPMRLKQKIIKENNLQ